MSMKFKLHIDIKIVGIKIAKYCECMKKHGPEEHLTGNN